MTGFPFVASMLILGSLYLYWHLAPRATTPRGPRGRRGLPRGRGEGRPGAPRARAASPPRTTHVGATVEQTAAVPALQRRRPVVVR